MGNQQSIGGPTWPKSSKIRFLPSKILCFSRGYSLQPKMVCSTKSNHPNEVSEKNKSDMGMLVHARWGWSNAKVIVNQPQNCLGHKTDFKIWGLKIKKLKVQSSLCTTYYMNLYVLYVYVYIYMIPSSDHEVPHNGMGPSRRGRLRGFSQCQNICQDECHGGDH